MGVKQVKFWYWLVAQAHRKVVYFCFMHVLLYATTGKYGDTEIGKLTCLEAIGRYEKKYKVQS